METRRGSDHRMGDLCLGRSAVVDQRSGADVANCVDDASIALLLSSSSASISHGVL